MQIEQAAEVAPVDARLLRRAGQRFGMALDQLLQIPPFERTDALLLGLFEGQMRVDHILGVYVPFVDPQLEAFERRVLRAGQHPGALKRIPQLAYVPWPSVFS